MIPNLVKKIFEIELPFPRIWINFCPSVNTGSFTEWFLLFHYASLFAYTWMSWISAERVVVLRGFFEKVVIIVVDQNFVKGLIGFRKYIHTFKKPTFWSQSYVSFLRMKNLNLRTASFNVLYVSWDIGHFLSVLFSAGGTRIKLEFFLQA